MGPGLYNVLYMAMDASKNEATCNFTIEVKGINENTHVYNIFYRVIHLM